MTTANLIHKFRGIAALIGGLVWLTWLGSLALGTGTTDLTGRLVGADHLAFYSPARLIRDGRDAEIYDHLVLWDYQKSLFAPGVWTEFEAYRNPPFYALLYVPTARLPYAVSFAIWSAIGLLGLALGIRWLGAERPWRALGWALTFLPVFAACNYGQNSLLSFTAFAGSYRLLLAQRPFFAGLVAGLLWFKPPLLLGLLFWWVLDLRNYWRALAGVVVTGLILTLGSYAIIPQAWDGFIAGLQDNAAFDNFQWWKMHNPRGFARLLFPDTRPLPTILWLLSAAVGAGWFGWIWHGNRDRLAVVYGASIVLMLWASPHTMIYEWTIAVIPAVLWWEAAAKDRHRWLVLFGIGWGVFFVATDASELQDRFGRSWFGWASPPVFQVSVPVVGWLAWQAGRLLTCRTDDRLQRSPAAGNTLSIADRP